MKKKLKVWNANIIGIFIGGVEMLSGALLYDTAKIRMEVIGGYTWEGRLTDYEINTYSYRYAGIILIIAGIIGVITALYIDLCENKARYKSPASQTDEIEEP